MLVRCQLQINGKRSIHQNESPLNQFQRVQQFLAIGLHCDDYQLKILIVLKFEVGGLEVDGQFFGDAKILGSWVRRTSDFLRKSRESKVERSDTLHFQQLFEPPTLRYRQSKTMRHIFKRLVHSHLLFQSILYIIQQLQFPHHSKQTLLIDGLDIQIAVLDVLYNFLMYFGLVEVGQQLLPDAHQYNNMDFKNIFSKKEEEEESCFPKLSFTERMIAFAICVGLGYVLQILSFGAILSIATGNPAKFAIIYSLGNVLTLAATGFLIGFRRQIKNMSDPDRKITSFVFIGALFGTLLAALVFESKVLVILFLVVQIPAYIWYCASYIPFARSCIKSCLEKCFKKTQQ